MLSSALVDILLTICKYLDLKLLFCLLFGTPFRQRLIISSSAKLFYNLSVFKFLLFIGINPVSGRLPAQYKVRKNNTTISFNLRHKAAEFLVEYYQNLFFWNMQISSNGSSCFVAMYLFNFFSHSAVELHFSHLTIQFFHRVVMHDRAT